MFLHSQSLEEEFDSYIVVSFSNATLVLSIGDTVEEVTDSGFLDKLHIPSVGPGGAQKLADKHPTALVLGCDQVLDFSGRAWGKPETIDAARTQLRTLRGKTHRLHSAIVLCDAGQPVWRHIGEARLTMRDFSDSFLDDYLARNWESIRSAVGCYKLEEEGVRLFSAIEGDYFTILGLPLVPLLGYLAQREFIPS